MKLDTHELSLWTVGPSSRAARGTIKAHPDTKKSVLTGCRYKYETGEISPDVAEQAEQTLLNIENALKEAGSHMGDVVRVRYILPDRTEFPKIWPVLKNWFGDVRPAATMIQSGLMKEEMKIEIEVTAKIGCGTIP